MLTEFLQNIKLLSVRFIYVLPTVYGIFNTPLLLQAHHHITETECQTFWEWNVRSNSHVIHYIEKGEGPNHVLLIHGFGAYSYTWRYIMNDLVNAGYHVWAIDLLGFGFSDKPYDADYNLHLFTAQIEAFMQAKHLSSATLIGNSMGGGLALAMSIFYPHRVKSLVLINALVYPIPLPIYFSAAKILGNWSKPFFGRAMIRKVLNDIIYDTNKISEEQIKAYEHPLHMPGGKEALIKTLQNFNHKELENLTWHFTNIKVPMLIIWGEKDQWMPINYYQRLSHAFPSAQGILISDCGHIPQEERPQEVLDAILNFYQALDFLHFQPNF